MTDLNPPEQGWWGKAHQAVQDQTASQMGADPVLWDLNREVANIGMEDWESEKKQRRAGTSAVAFGLDAIGSGAGQLLDAIQAPFYGARNLVASGLNATGLTDLPIVDPPSSKNALDVMATAIGSPVAATKSAWGEITGSKWTTEGTGDDEFTQILLENQARQDWNYDKLKDESLGIPLLDGLRMHHLRTSAEIFGGTIGFVAGPSGKIIDAASKLTSRAATKVLGKSARGILKGAGVANETVAKAAQNGTLFELVAKSVSGSPKVKALIADNVARYTGAMVGFGAETALRGAPEGPEETAEEASELMSRLEKALVHGPLGVIYVGAGRLASTLERGPIKKAVDNFFRGRAQHITPKVAGAIAGSFEGMGFTAMDLRLMRDLMPAVMSGDFNRIVDIGFPSFFANMAAFGGLRFVSPSNSAMLRRDDPEAYSAREHINRDLGVSASEVDPSPGRSADELVRSGWRYRQADKPEPAQEGKVEKKKLELDAEGKVVKEEVTTKEERAELPEVVMDIPGVEGEMRVRYNEDGSVHSLEVDGQVAEYVSGQRARVGKKTIRLEGERAEMFHNDAEMQGRLDGISGRIFLHESSLKGLELKETGQNEWSDLTGQRKFTYRRGRLYEQLAAWDGIGPWTEVKNWQTKRAQVGTSHNEEGAHQAMLGRKLGKAWDWFTLGVQSQYGSNPTVRRALATFKQAQALLLDGNPNDPAVQEAMRLFDHPEAMEMARRAAETGEIVPLLRVMNELSAVADGLGNAGTALQRLAEHLVMDPFRAEEAAAREGEQRAAEIEEAQKEGEAKLDKEAEGEAKLDAEAKAEEAERVKAGDMGDVQGPPVPPKVAEPAKPKPKKAKAKPKKAKAPEPAAEPVAEPAEVVKVTRVHEPKAHSASEMAERVLSEKDWSKEPKRDARSAAKTAIGYMMIEGEKPNLSEVERRTGVTRKTLRKYRDELQAEMAEADSRLEQLERDEEGLEGMGPESGAALNPFSAKAQHVGGKAEAPIVSPELSKVRTWVNALKTSFRRGTNVLATLGKKDSNLRARGKKLAGETHEVSEHMDALRGEWTVENEKLVVELRELAAQQFAKPGGPVTAKEYVGRHMRAKTADKPMVEREMEIRYGKEFAKKLIEQANKRSALMDRGLELGKQLGVTRGKKPLTGSGSTLPQRISSEWEPYFRAIVDGDFSHSKTRELADIIRKNNKKLSAKSDHEVHQELLDLQVNRDVMGDNPYFTKTKIELPFEVLENNPDVLMQHQLETNAAFLAAFKKWGEPSAKGAGLPKLVEQINAIGNLDRGVKDPILKFYRQHFGGAAPMSSFGRMAGHFGAYQTLTKLGPGFTSALRNMSQAVVATVADTSMLTQAQTVLHAGFLLASGRYKGQVERYRRLGIIKGSTAESDIPQNRNATARRAMNAWMKAWGVVEQGNQFYTAKVFEAQFGKDMRRLLDESPSWLRKTIDKIQHFTLTEAGTKGKIRRRWKELTGDKLTDESMLEYGRKLLDGEALPPEVIGGILNRITHERQFGLTLASERLWYREHPWARHGPGKFMPFFFDMNGYMAKRVFIPAFGKGSYIPFHKGDPMPLLKTMAIAGLVNSAIHGFFGKTEDLDLDNADDVRKFLSSPPGKVLTGFVRSIPIADLASFGMSSGKIGIGPIEGSTWNFGRFVNQVLASDFDDFDKAFRELVLGEVAGIRQAKNLYDRMRANFTEDGQRSLEIGSWRRATRDYSNTLDKSVFEQALDRATGNVSDFAISERSTKMADARDHIQSGDAEEAAEEIAARLRIVRYENAGKTDEEIAAAMKEEFNTIAGSLYRAGPNAVRQTALKEFVDGLSPDHLKRFTKAVSFWEATTDAAMERAQQMVGSSIEQPNRFKSRARMKLSLADYKKEIADVITEAKAGAGGAGPLIDRFGKQYDAWADVAKKNPKALLSERGYLVYQKVLERGIDPDEFLRVYFESYMIRPELIRQLRKQREQMVKDAIEANK